MPVQYERTTPPYRTEGPGEGRSWADYFRVRRSDLLDSQPGPGCDGGELASDVGGTVLKSDRSGLLGDAAAATGFWASSVGDGLAAREGSNPPRSAVTYVKQLLAADWDVAVGYAHYFEVGGVYGPAAAKAGEEKPDDDIETHSVHACKKGKGRVRIVFWTKLGGKPTCVLRSASGLGFDQVGDAELKAWIAS